MKIFNFDIDTNIDFKSLKFKIWCYFAMFAIIIFCLLWFMQVIFLQSSYTIMKKSEIIKLADKIESEYKKGNFVNTIDETAYKNSVNILLLDGKKNLIYTSEMTGNITRTFRPDIIDVNELIDNMIESKNGKISYTTQLTKYKSQMFIYGTAIPNSNIYLVLMAPIDPIDSTTNVLQSQLVYITIISLIFSSIISIFISRKLAKPIVNIDEAAKKLAKGDYDVIFEKGDYTEIDNLVTTLNHTTTELSKTDKLRKELIANVSHDLRTPLTMIKAYAEMIKDLSGENKKKREEHLKVIIDESDRLTRLINDMMDLSKMQSGINEINKTEFNIVDTINHILKGFRVLHEKDGFEFLLNSPEEIKVNADETKIEQVLYNLIINAVNYSEENKKITINVLDEENKVKVEVVDNGCGISKDKLEYIWDRYYKSGEVHKTSKAGTGLGLSIVKNILEKHSGNYGVESIEGMGSKFWFELNK